MLNPRQTGARSLRHDANQRVELGAAGLRRYTRQSIGSHASSTRPVNEHLEALTPAHQTWRLESRGRGHPGTSTPLAREARPVLLRSAVRDNSITAITESQREKIHYTCNTNMALTQSFGTSTADASRPASQQRPESSQLPPPQTFDILPHLHEILARIDHVPNDPMQAATIEDDVVTYAELQPLEPKDLQGEVQPIKSKIRKALRELEKLPDMDRDVEEQEAEIKMLQVKAAKQREVLRQLGDVAKSKMR